MGRQKGSLPFPRLMCIEIHACLGQLVTCRTFSSPLGVFIKDGGKEPNGANQNIRLELVK